MCCRGAAAGRPTVLLLVILLVVEVSAEDAILSTSPCLLLYLSCLTCDKEIYTKPGSMAHTSNIGILELVLVSVAALLFVIKCMLVTIH